MTSQNFLSKIRLLVACCACVWASASMADSLAQSNLAQAASPSEFIKTSYNTTSRDLSARQSVMADRILVEKQKRKLTLLTEGQVLKQYRISLGREPTGRKIISGDNRTPEGVYYIDYRVRESDFHRALHISYPNDEDILRAQELGAPPGGSIMLHGLKNDDREIAYYHGYFDWTKGCIAVTDSEIEEIWQLVPNGTPIEIRP